MSIQTETSGQYRKSVYAKQVLYHLSHSAKYNYTLQADFDCDSQKINFENNL